MNLSSTAALSFFAGSALSVAISATLAGAGEPDLRRPGPAAAMADVATRGNAQDRPDVPGVFNCADSGTGSLRAAVAAAVSGDVIDLTQLSCSTISLTTGAIVVPVNDLSIVGPGEASLTISRAESGLPYSRLFTHVGSGTLSLARMTLVEGREAGSGGCVFSAGNISLQSATVYDCTSTDTNGVSIGGGAVFAAGSVSLRATQIGTSGVLTNHGDARGGGIYAGGALYARDSSISQSAAVAQEGMAFGGGAFVRGGADVERCSIFNNRAGSRGNGVPSLPGNVGGASLIGPTRLVNSLIAGNDANGVIGGLYLNSTSANLHNSTIAINTAAFSRDTNNAEYAAGVFLYYTSVNLQSTIISGNTFGNAILFDLNGTVSTVTGSHNLVTGSAIAPPDSLQVDPQFDAPLIHEKVLVFPLSATSPAIDRGSNPDALGTDQRGAGYPRVSGAAADIGAFELQAGPGDRIFANGFEAPAQSHAATARARAAVGAGVAVRPPIPPVPTG